MVLRSQLWIPLVYSCVLSTVLAVPTKSSSADKAALLAFKAVISSDQGLLASWTSSSNPCDHTWLGVSCNCSDIKPPLSVADCAAVQKANPEDVVVSLDLGNPDEKVSVDRQLTGFLAPELGNLAFLQSLRLDGHNLQVGSAPILYIANATHGPINHH